MAVVAQSGGVAGLLLERAQDRGVGVSQVVCTGNEADVTVGEVLGLLAGDPATGSAAVYMEAIRQGPALLDGLRAMRDAGKGVVMLKVGATEAGARASAAHTGALADDDDVFNAALDASGAVRVTGFDDLIATAGLLAPTARRAAGDRHRLDLRRGRRVATEAAERAGLVLPPLGEATRARLVAAAPDFAAVANPADMSGMFVEDPEIFRGSLAAFLEEPAIEAVVLVLTVHPPELSDELARRSIEAARAAERPLVVLCTAGAMSDPARATLREAGVPVIEDADRCMTALAARARAGRAAGAPLPPPTVALPALDAARAAGRGARARGPRGARRGRRPHRAHRRLRDRRRGARRRRRARRAGGRGGGRARPAPQERRRRGGDGGARTRRGGGGLHAGGRRRRAGPARRSRARWCRAGGTRHRADRGRPARARARPLPGRGARRVQAELLGDVARRCCPCARRRAGDARRAAPGAAAARPPRRPGGRPRRRGPWRSRAWRPRRPRSAPTSTPIEVNPLLARPDGVVAVDAAAPLPERRAMRDDYSHLIGHRFPGGTATIPGLGRLALARRRAGRAARAEASTPASPTSPAVQGSGVTFQDIFDLAEATAESGPMFGEQTLTFEGALETDTEYAVEGEITDVVRKQGRRAGTFDMLTFELRLRDAGRRARRDQRQHLHLPARDGRGGMRISEVRVGTELEPFVVDVVSAEKMKLMAALLHDPNPIHLDAEAVRGLGMGDRVVNQGPANQAYLVNMLLALRRRPRRRPPRHRALPGQRLRRRPGGVPRPGDRG